MPKAPSKAVAAQRDNISILQGLFSDKYQASRASMLNVFERWAKDWLGMEPGPTRRYHPNHILAFCHFLVLNESSPQCLINAWGLLISSYQIIYVNTEMTVTKLICPEYAVDGLRTRRSALMAAVCRRPLAKAPVLTRQAVERLSDRLKPIALLWLFSGLRISEFITINTTGVTPLPDGSGWILLPNRRKVGGATRPVYVWCNCKRVTGRPRDTSWCPIHQTTPARLPLPINAALLDTLIAIAEIQGHSFRRTLIVMLRLAVEAGFITYRQMNFLVHMAENSRTCDGYAQGFEIIGNQEVTTSRGEESILVPCNDYLINARERLPEMLLMHGFMQPSSTRPAKATRITAEDMLKPVDGVEEPYRGLSPLCVDYLPTRVGPSAALAGPYHKAVPRARPSQISTTGSHTARGNSGSTPVPSAFRGTKSIWHLHRIKQCSQRLWGDDDDVYTPDMATIEEVEGLDPETFVDLDEN